MRKLLFLFPLMLLVSMPARAATSLSASDTGACTTAGACLVVPVTSNSASVGFAIGANASGNTIQFEGCVDSCTTAANWNSVNAYPTNSTTAVTSSTSANVIYRAAVSGLTQVRMRMSTLVSGTTSVSIAVSSGGLGASVGGGGGSGTVSGQANGVIPLATGSTTIGAQSHMDDGNTTASTITSSETVAAPEYTTTGTTAGLIALVGATSNPSIPSNAVGFLGPASASLTSYVLQLPSTAPSGTQYLGCGTPSSNVSTCAWATVSGSGTVTSFSSGNLSPLFTTSVATATTTPALTFSLSNAAAGTVFGNATGSSAGPAFTSAPVLGVSGTAGTLGMFPSSGNFTTTLGSAATASNTFLFPAAVFTNNHIGYCAVSSTTCTWTDAGYAYNSIPNADLANSSITVNTSSPLGGGGAVSLGSSLTLTCSTCNTSAAVANPPFDKSSTGLSNPTADATFTQPAASVSGWTLAGTAPTSVSTSTGTTATTLFNVNGVTGGATSNASGTGGAGSAPTIAGGTGGAGTGTNAVGGAGGAITLTAGNGGASNGTGANSNGGNLTVNLGAPGTGGSGTAGKNGVMAVSDSTHAGFVYYTQGTVGTTSTVNIPANSIIESAPSSVTAYEIEKPGAAPSNTFSAQTCTDASPAICSWNKTIQEGVSTGSYTNATTTASNVTGLSFSVEASTNYAMTCHLYFSASATTAGINAEITGPSSPTTVSYVLHQPLTSTTYTDSPSSAFSTKIGVTTSTTASTVFDATLTMGLQNGSNAGTVQVQLAAAGTGTLTLENGSFCQMQ